MQADGVDLSRALHRLYGTDTPPAQLLKLKGDASSRSYYRLTLSPDAPATMRPRSLIVMRLPDDALASDERSGTERPTELPFVDVQRMLYARGVPVPEIYVDDTQGRILLLQDLGDETFADRLMQCSVSSCCRNESTCTASSRASSASRASCAARSVSTPFCGC